VTKNISAMSDARGRALAAEPIALNRQVEALLRRLRMAVVHGGDKSAAGAVLGVAGNQRSWKSYRSVAQDIAAALGRLGCRTPIEVLPDDMQMSGRLRDNQTHLAWLNTAGVQGASAITHAPGMLEMLGIPYIGHEPLLAGILDNKHLFKQQLTAAGIPTAPSLLIRPSQRNFCPTQDDRFLRVFGACRGPFIVKPVSGRASLHVTFVDSILRLREAVAAVIAATEAPVLVERYLGGPEYCVAICGPVIARGGVLSRHERPFVFSALERRLESDEKIFTSMDLKPISGDRARLLHPALDRRALLQLSGLAYAVFDEFGVETLIRLDVRSDEDGNMFILEANPKPDLKAPEAGQTSLVSIGLAEHGMSYDDLILSILANRVDRLIAEGHGTIGRLAGIS
jgi:D-alanine-D-alanine ligase